SIQHKSVCARAYTVICFFFFNGPATTAIYTLSLHDALPICWKIIEMRSPRRPRISPTGTFIRSVPSKTTSPASIRPGGAMSRMRSEEHTSELQSQSNLVCRLLLEKKKKNKEIDRNHDNSVAH